MQTFWYLAGVSYFMGSLPIEGLISTWLTRREAELGWLFSRLPISFPDLAGNIMGIGKGLGVVLLARAWTGTHMGLVLATLFLMIGHMWPLAGRYKPRPVAFALLGAFVMVEPRGLPFLITMGLAAYAVTRSMHASTLMSGICIPFFMYYTHRPDNSVLLGMIAAGLIAYQALGYMEILWGLEADQGTSGAENRARRLRRWRTFARRAAFLGLVLLVVTTFFFNRYVYRGFGLGVHFLRQGPAEFELVVLSFDDGPDPRYTPAILDTLAHYGVKAVFFVVGEKVERYPELARRILDEGHEIGNHTYSHRNLYRLPTEDKITEIERAEEVIKAATGERPNLFRPPRGMYDAELLELLEERRYTMVLYSLSSRDWTEIPHQDMARHVLSRASPGDIMLFHDSGDLIRHDGGTRINTVRALPLIIEGLQERGYSFISVLEMLIITGLTASP